MIPDSRKILKSKKLIIFLASLLFTLPFLSKAKESGVLFLWEISQNKIWKRFGDKETQQKYNGEIKYGNPHGLGINIYLDGTKYIGQWRHGKRHGQGTLIFPDGTKLSGNWKDNKEWNIKIFYKNSRVSDFYVDGIKQINNRKEGILFFREVNGKMGWHETGDEKKDYKYIGEIEKVKPNGWGKLTYPSGYTYEGQYKNGKVHGHGSFTFPDGKTAVGKFKENKPWNVKEFDNKSNMISEYVDGILIVKKKRVGILFTRKEKNQWIWFEDNSEPYGGKYDGEIEAGKPDGQGTIIYLNGTKYVGSFKDGNWNGQGIFYFPNGDKWVGFFKNDAPWDIIWYDKNGNLNAKWENGIKNNSKP